MERIQIYSYKTEVESIIHVYVCYFNWDDDI